ncbi:glycosyltransferase family 2 protein [Ruegeria arenilitoris]|uniref:glycosyltransferase family 2 protein n=1 Tax=Ruegeria arenilitoris TaxID=1173585 RepID=UPI00147CAC65|nr:glycosyltransferase [Ruegeria arenilitoris]
MDRRSTHLKITVSTLTRQRPEMLSALLESWGEMGVPENCSVQCLVVENDSVPFSEDVVRAYEGTLPNGVPLLYALETEPGIPFGRNCAARNAIAQKSDLLCFIDDDETVASDWLDNLVTGYRTSSAVLLGAPLRAAPPSGGESAIQRLMLSNIKNRYLTKERKASKRATLEDTGGVTIVTNNWLGETRLFTDHNIWFDETMRMTGGTDAKFYAETVAAGLPVGWVDNAFVYERIPPERLSFWYQAARGRDQSNTYMRRKLEQRPVNAVAQIAAAPLRIVALAGLIILLPFQPQKRFIDIARTAGWLVGVLGIPFGYKSELYKKVTGH